MNHPDFVSSALFEHRFWLQVMGDHARFIMDSLSPKETEEIQRSTVWVRIYDDLLQRARSETNEQIVELSQESYHRTLEFRAFKLHLLRRHLTDEIGLHLPPSFLNHMVNELEEYVRILGSLVKAKSVPVFGDLHYHLLWLEDAYGHAGLIASDLDMAETRLVEMARTFDQHFRDYYLKAVELAGYLRTQVRQFPALARFNQEVELEMSLFKQFLRELEELRLTRKMLGTLSPLMADHMAREECYYLTKLSQVTELNTPNCDPAKPRTE